MNSGSVRARRQVLALQVQLNRGLGAPDRANLHDTSGHALEPRQRFTQHRLELRLTALALLFRDELDVHLALVHGVVLLRTADRRVGQLHLGLRLEVGDDVERLVGRVTHR